MRKPPRCPGGLAIRDAVPQQLREGGPLHLRRRAAVHRLGASTAGRARSRGSGGEKRRASEGRGIRGVPSIFILARDPNLLRKPSKTRGNSRFLKRSMVEKEKESTPRGKLYVGACRKLQVSRRSNVST